MSNFPDNVIEIDNPQSKEEDEDLEEQRRRQEELADLLATGIHAFNYDESTMNSSVTSVEGVDEHLQETSKNLADLKSFKYDESERKSLSNLSDIEKTYKDAFNQDQLKILYEVRVREIQNLREEFTSYQAEKAKEISNLKNKATLLEAELHHVQVSLANAESLLVEKTGVINDLKQVNHNKDEEINKLKKLVDELKMEICAHTSTLAELQLMQANNNPFNFGAQKFKSEELQRVHQEQTLKLETLLEEQTKKVELLEKEKNKFLEEIQRIVKNRAETDEENNLTIVALSKKLQMTQQQCKDLFILGEAIKKESDHFKERLQQLETNRIDMLGSDDNKLKKIDKETLNFQLEKLKRMLLDKDIEMNTLKAKLKFYDTDLEELFEYRNILNTMYTCEIKPCSNREHEELLIFMQRQLQSYQQAVEDRNNQIMSLTVAKNELQEKIEEMLQQTRTDIKNISEKYSLPQLETMSNELKNAEMKINELSRQLVENEKDLQKIEVVQMELTKAHKLIQNLEATGKANEEQLGKLMEENAKLKSELHNDSNLDDVKAKYGKVHAQLVQVAEHLENNSHIAPLHKLKELISHYLNGLNSPQIAREEVEKNVKIWYKILKKIIENSGKDESFEDLTNAKTTLECQKFALEYQLQSCCVELEDAKKEIERLASAKDSDEENLRIIRKLTNELEEVKEYVKLLETTKTTLEKQLENVQKQLNEAKDETMEVRKEVNEAADSSIKKNLFKALKDLENAETNTDISGTELFQTCLQARILKAEISLRDSLNEENLEKIKKIEEQYKKVLTERAETFNKEKENWKQLEGQYRKHFASILDQCGQKIDQLERDNANLLKQIRDLLNEYKMYKKNSITAAEKSEKMLIESRKSVETLNVKWGNLLHFYMKRATQIERQTQNNINSLLKKIASNQHQVKVQKVSNKK